MKTVNAFLALAALAAVVLAGCSNDDKAGVTDPSRSELAEGRGDCCTRVSRSFCRGRAQYWLALSFF